MRTLYHLWLSPQCRKVRILLQEKRLPVHLEVEPIWERRTAFLALNPAGDLPVLVEPEGQTIADHGAICEYLDEAYPEPTLIGADPFSRAEARRLAAWFDTKFDHEVSRPLVAEKVMKRVLNQGEPDSRAIRAATINLGTHLDYLTWLVDRRKWLAGDAYSLADIAAGAHLSAVDYCGDVPWSDYPQVKDWYVRLKSRPSFRPILSDHIPGAAPPRHYADLDF